MEKYTMILNLTQHQGLPEQNVKEPENAALIRELLTFKKIPTKMEIDNIAQQIASIALVEIGHHPQPDIKPSLGAYHAAAMIGGAPYLMAALEESLKAVGIQPLYAFSERQSVEKVIDGQVVKQNIFAHIGFVIV